jgi:hypothetical protein
VELSTSTVMVPVWCATRNWQKHHRAVVPVNTRLHGDQRQVDCKHCTTGPTTVGRQPARSYLGHQDQGQKDQPKQEATTTHELSGADTHAHTPAHTRTHTYTHIHTPRNTTITTVLASGNLPVMGTSVSTVTWQPFGGRATARGNLAVEGRKGLMVRTTTDCARRCCALVISAHATRPTDA